MNDDTPRPGLAAQAIQESHLSMEKAHRQFRRARDEGEHVVGDEDPKAAYQDAVMTFYELLRPYLKSESQLEAYWNGHIPDYPPQPHRSVADARQYYEDRCVGVHQIQMHTIPTELNQQVLTGGGSDVPQTPEQWHQILQRPSVCRVVSAQPGDEDDKDNRWYIRELRFAVMGLRELDHWKAEVTTERTQGSGFMAGETHIQQRREYESAEKITKAKRMLTEAANKLGALPDYSIEDSRDASFDYSDLLQAEPATDGGETHGDSN